MAVIYKIFYRNFIAAVQIRYRSTKSVQCDSYLETLQTAYVHHVVSVLGDHLGVLESVEHGGLHVRRAARLAGVLINLLHQEVVLLDALDRLDQQIGQLETIANIREIHTREVNGLE